MKDRRIKAGAFFVAIFLFGCATAGPHPLAKGQKPEDRQQVESALGSVTAALSDQTVTQKQVRDLEAQIQKDKEAQTAVKAIAGSLQTQRLVVKYCPIDGKRYSEKILMCPQHRVPLKELTE